jgi:hypothetical protein
MSPIVLLVTLLAWPQLAIAQSGQSALTGTWVTYNFGGEPNLINIEVNGSRAVVTISRNQAVNTMRDATVSGNTITFRSSGLRFTNFTGRLNGDELVFTRDVQILPGGANAGGGIYGGSQAPTEFVAHRDAPAGLAVPRAIFGSWRLNIERSTFDPVLAAAPYVPKMINFVAHLGGRVALLSTEVGSNPLIQYDFSMLKADGQDHPLHNEVSLGEQAMSGAETPYAMSLSALGNGVFQMVAKSSGVVTSRRRLSVSPDGNTLTAVETIVNAQGATTATNRLVFDRALTVEPRTAPTN